MKTIITIVLFFISFTIYSQREKFYSKGEMSLSENDTVLALKYFKKSIKRDSRDIKGHSSFQIAEIFRVKNDSINSINYYKESIWLHKNSYRKLKGDNKWSRMKIYEMAICYYYTKNYKQAYMWCKKSLKVGISPDSIYYDRIMKFFEISKEKSESSNN